MEDNAQNTPFFLWVDSFSPHELWDPPRQYADAYFKDESVKDYIYPLVLNDMNPSDAEVERTKALYLGYVTFVDRWIGHFLESLDRLNLKDDTVVMFLSDHGTQVWDRGRFGKGPKELFPFNTQLNWFIRHPDGPRGKHVDAWVQNQDLTPTILRMMGVDCDEMDGVDAWAIATGKTSSSRDHATTGWANQMCVRDESYSVHFPVTQSEPEAEVYDLKADPDEETPMPNPPENVVKEALARATAAVGPLPVTFRQFDQRHVARSMRTFAPKRFGESAE
ncbi:MAG: sulfatase-like hydrolase/transferase [bacterium]|nr:sulfatase-like hydrolase/transferase [bacterium]